MIVMSVDFGNEGEDLYAISRFRIDGDFNAACPRDVKLVYIDSTEYRAVEIEAFGVPVITTERRPIPYYHN